MKNARIYFILPTIAYAEADRQQVNKSQMGLKVTTQLSTVEWIAPKVGTVKSESYNKNGKLSGYTVLSKRNN